MVVTKASRARWAHPRTAYTLHPTLYTLHPAGGSQGVAGDTGSWGISGRGTTSAEDAQGTPTQSHISPSILVYEDYQSVAGALGASEDGLRGVDGAYDPQNATTPSTTC